MVRKIPVCNGYFSELTKRLSADRPHTVTRSHNVTVNQLLCATFVCSIPLVEVSELQEVEQRLIHVMWQL